MAKWWQYILNPLIVTRDIAKAIDKKAGNMAEQTERGEPVEQYHDSSSSLQDSVGQSVSESVRSIWDDLTGKSQIELQNQLQRELAEEEYQRNLQAIGDTAAAYEAAGFNRNLLYSGASPSSYSAPNLQAYSGTQKLDRILQKTGQLLGLIPAMYQATAALEGIDQARERTKQSEIKTMSMGMSLLDQGYKLGDLTLSHPFSFDLGQFKGGKRRYDYVNPADFMLHGYGRGHFEGNRYVSYFNPNDLGRYADAALKNKFDLLSSIGIKNEMNSTLNNWRGYQYSLDRRFGAAGRIVGMGSQGLRAVGSLFSPIKLGGFK